MSAVYAMYPDPQAAQRAVNALRAAGLVDRQIHVISSEPFEEFEFSERDKPTWIYWLSGLGGVIGFLTGVSLTWFTQVAWPLPTGGMPIVAWWANLVVIFELTMLGAILTAVITLIVTASLLRRKPVLYDDSVTEGLILVGVSPLESIPRARIEQALQSVHGVEPKFV